MSKIVVAGLTALFISASPLAYAQAPSVAGTAAGAAHELLSPAEAKALTDRRIEIVRYALQLTPDQVKYWPAIEEAIRARATTRYQRLEALMARRLGERDPIEFMRDRSEVLAQRAAGLKKLADAWQPLYQTLDPGQKLRMRFLAVHVLREVRDAVESRLMQAEDEYDD